MAATSTARSERQPSRRQAAIVAATLALAIAIPATAFAAKGGGTATPSWIALATVDGDTTLAAAQPRLGSSVRFASGYPSNTRNPWVSVTCWQDGNLVWGSGGKPSADFSLGGASSVWLEVGGAATCRAELGDLFWRGGKQYYTYLAHTTFDAAG
jgi:hypothetical protein